MIVDAEEAEELALKFAAANGKLIAAVQWCVDHSDECLGDHPKQLAKIKQILVETKTILPDPPS